jgi:hypothetical protein
MNHLQGSHHDPTKVRLMRSQSECRSTEGRRRRTSCTSLGAAGAHRSRQIDGYGPVAHSESFGDPIPLVDVPDPHGDAVSCVRAVVKALLMRVAPGRRCWSRWSARSEARTYDLDQPEGRCRLAMGRLAAAWGRPAFPGCSTNVVSSATTIVIGCPPFPGSAVASVLEGRPALLLAGMALAGADRGGDS